MNARRVSVGTGEGAKGPAAACCERLVAYQVHGVQQEVLHHAVPRAGAVVARDEADGDARVLGGVDGAQHGGELGFRQLRDDDAEVIPLLEHDVRQRLASR